MSKYMLFDFRCQDCDEKSEQFVKPDVLEMSCPDCSGTMVRCVSAPTIDLGVNSDKWARTNKQKVAQDRKFFKEHGADKKHHSYGS